jgi:hypothetical protein
MYPEGCHQTWLEIPELAMAGWWFQSFFMFHNRWDVILPIDFHIFQRGRYTTNQMGMMIDGWFLSKPRGPDDRDDQVAIT